MLGTGLVSSNKCYSNVYGSGLLGWGALLVQATSATRIVTTGWSSTAANQNVW